MATPITMPKLSDTMEEGGIFAWLVEEGAYVEEGDPLAEIETDKATMEYASPVSGYVLSFVVQAGEQAALGSPIAILGDSADEAVDLSAFGPNQNQNSATAAPSLDANSNSQEEGYLGTSQTSSETSGPSPSSPSLRIKISPLAKKLAQDAGISLTSMIGSGHGGRIVKRDIEAALRQHQSTALPSVPPPSAVPPPPSPPDAPAKTLPVSMMRKSIAQNLVASKQQIPHYYLRTNIIMDAILAWRAKLNAYAQKHSLEKVKVSVNDLFVWASAHALTSHSVMRSSWQQDHIQQTSGSHIAVAVAVPDGLVTPVLFHAHTYGLLDLSAQLRTLIIQAQDPHARAKLPLSGGNFTVSNLGMSDVHEFAAIINPGQSAILAVGKTQKVPVVIQDEIKIVSQATVTLSCDHRLVDGMEGARFLSTLKTLIEDPMMALK